MSSIINMNQRTPAPSPASHRISKENIDPDQNHDDNALYRTPQKSPLQKVLHSFTSPSLELLDDPIYSTPLKSIKKAHFSTDILYSVAKFPDRLDQSAASAHMIISPKNVPKTPKKSHAFTPARQFVTPSGMDRNRTPLKVASPSLSTTKKARKPRISRVEQSFMNLNIQQHQLFEEERGSVIVMNQIKSSKVQKEMLGSDKFVSPVRHSLRLGPTSLSHPSNGIHNANNSSNTPFFSSKSEAKKFHLNAILKQSDYSYVPNPFVQNTYFDEKAQNSAKLTPCKNSTPKKLIFQ